MAMVRKTITVTEKMDAWIKSRVESGDYGNDSEYIRDLMRRDEGKSHAEAKLLEMLIAAENSGTSNESFDEIWEQGIKRAEDRMRKTA